MLDDHDPISDSFSDATLEPPRSAVPTSRDARNLGTVEAHTKDIKFGGPASYRIVIQGVLGEAWSDRVAGLAITTLERDDGEPHTTLTGPIRDQAELNGVLETLYGLHLPILRVEKLENEE